MLNENILSLKKKRNIPQLIACSSLPNQFRIASCIIYVNILVIGGLHFSSVSRKAHSYLAENCEVILADVCKAVRYNDDCFGM